MSASLPSDPRALARPLGVTLLALAVVTAAVARHPLGDAGSLLLGTVMAAGAVILLTRAASRRSLPRRAVAVAVAAIPVMAIYALSAVAHGDAGAYSNVAQLALAVTFALGASQVPWGATAVTHAHRVYSTVVVGLALWWAALGFPVLFRGPLGHPNAVGQFTLLASFFALAALAVPRRHRLPRVLVWLSLASAGALLAASGSRAVWLAAVTSGFAYVTWPILARRRWGFHLTFVVAMAAVTFLTWLYLIAPDHAWGWRLDEVVRAVTGQSLFSGRQRFWGDVWTAIAARPWLGHGAGAVADDFTSLGWSAHNLYMQTALQVGLLGLAGLWLLLGTIWSQLWAGRRDRIVRLAAAFLLGTLVHQVFEVSLTQNNLATGLTTWLIVAVGLERSWSSAP